MWDGIGTGESGARGLAAGRFKESNADAGSKAGAMSTRESRLESVRMRFDCQPSRCGTSAPTSQREGKEFRMAIGRRGVCDRLLQPREKPT
jgi:hypothetical protein